MANFFDIFIFLALFEISNEYKLNRKSNFVESRTFNPRLNNFITDRFGNRSREMATKHYLRKQKEMRMRSDRSRANALRQDIRYLSELFEAVAAFKIILSEFNTVNDWMNSLSLFNSYASKH